MELAVRTRTNWSTVGAAFCGAIFGAMAVIAHEVHTVFVGRCPSIDPFVHIVTELAMFAPGGAILFADLADIRNRLVELNLRQTATEDRRY
jgi:hypothetical protein